MIINKVKFIKSSTEINQLPSGIVPEYAFIGRSNVGKSSLINMLTKTNIAKISKTPGKTKNINHFFIDDLWMLVDLPGYGYASVSKKMRNQWPKLIKDYTTKRKNLYCVMVLIDSRLPAQDIDIEFLEFLGSMQIAFVIVFTKADKLAKNALNKNITAYKQGLLKQWEFLPEIFITSAKTGQGANELLTFINTTNKS